MECRAAERPSSSLAPGQCMRHRGFRANSGSRARKRTGAGKSGAGKKKRGSIAESATSERAHVVKQGALGKLRENGGNKKRYHSMRPAGSLSLAIVTDSERFGGEILGEGFNRISHRDWI